MSILSVAQRACLAIGLDQPDVLMSSTDREYQELARICTDTAQMMIVDYDWQLLQKMATFTGDGVTEAFDMPSDYARMVETAKMWSSRWVWSLFHIVSVDEWLRQLVTPFAYVVGNWIIYGGQFHFRPIMAAGETIKFFYISDLIVVNGSGNLTNAFTADTDSFRLSERLLELGVIWRWKLQKGLPFEADKAIYDDAIQEEMTRDGGSRSVLSGNQPRNYLRGVPYAFPYSVRGTP